MINSAGDAKVRKAHTNMLVKKLAYLVAEREYILVSRPDDDLRFKVLTDIASLIQLTGSQIAADK